MDDISTIKWDELIPGGLTSKRRPEDFDSASIRDGLRVELKNTDDQYIAMEMAMDNLTIDPAYYKKLRTLADVQENVLREFLRLILKPV